jgi:hypothetical protein
MSRPTVGPGDAPTDGRVRPLLLCERCGVPVYEHETDTDDGATVRRLNCGCPREELAGYRYRTLDEALDQMDQYNPEDHNQ